MTSKLSAFFAAASLRSYFAGMMVWVLGGSLLAWLDPLVHLSNLSLLLVLIAALAAVWLPWGVGVLMGVLSVVIFNWAFVPPRGTLQIDLEHHVSLIVVMALVNGLIAALVQGLREQSQGLLAQAQEDRRWRQLTEMLREAPHPASCLESFADMVQEQTGCRPWIWLASEPDLASGSADDAQRQALAYCWQTQHPLGPGTGCYENLAETYLPLLTTAGALGALGLPQAIPKSRMPNLQKLCDTFASALGHAQLQLARQEAQQQAQQQTLRNTLLAAISHDYRTPLSTILSSASLLQEQSTRLRPEQQQELAGRIVHEASQLRRITTNLLQLARLDSPHRRLDCDWQSAEELLGACAERWRSRAPAEQLQVQVEPGLPLLWCDGVLITLLLDNLLDNALKFCPPGTEVLLYAKRSPAWLCLGVVDQGPGIDKAFEPHLFDAYARANKQAGPQGTGIGLALCNAIAQAHQGELRLCEADAGAHFECRLPPLAQPDAPPPEVAP